MKYFLKCRFCPKICGEWETNKPNPLAEISDIRCDDCTITYGSYQKMFQDFESILKYENNPEFEKMMKDAGYKKSEFDKLLEKRRKEVDKERKAKAETSEKAKKML